MEIKINKEICGYNEALFFGLSTRQFLCSVLAVGAAAGIYFGLKGVIGRETASWLCMVAAAPIAAMGFFRYNGLTSSRSYCQSAGKTFQPLITRLFPCTPRG